MVFIVPLTMAKHEPSMHSGGLMAGPQQPDLVSTGFVFAYHALETAPWAHEFWQSVSTTQPHFSASASALGEGGGSAGDAEAVAELDVFGSGSTIRSGEDALGEGAIAVVDLGAPSAHAMAATASTTTERSILASIAARSINVRAFRDRRERRSTDPHVPPRSSGRRQSNIHRCITPSMQPRPSPPRR
jgi:hypothetical protein